jgi:hypothetical protein
MKRTLLKSLAPVLAVFMLAACDNEQNITTNNDSSAAVLIDVAQTSAQLASGTAFRINGSSTDSVTSERPQRHGHGPHGHGGPGGDHHFPLDGVSLLPPTDELLAIAEAESAGDFRGLRMSARGGATITNYNSAGEEVTLPMSPGGPQGCSASGGQFGDYDSLLASIVRTEIDFGSGITYKRDTISITRAGTIVIIREGDASNLTETVTFENYTVNGIKITGTKTRISKFDEATGSGSSTTAVSNGTITLVDGTVADWTSDKSRVSELTLDSNGRPTGGTITTNVNTVVSDEGGNVIYSHLTTAPLVEDLSCGRWHAPASGTIETNYRDNKLAIDFGDGSCDDHTVTITINGETTTKTID